MSVLDPLRLHFRGKAFVHRPTANRNRNGEIDFPTSTVFVDGEPVSPDAPPSRYHEHLEHTGRRYGADGRPDPKGAFSENVGWNAGGNNHFIWQDTRIVSVQSGRGHVDRTADPLIGSLVEIWGHYNEYLRTTANRARFIDIDPSSRWTPHVIVGHLTFGRRAPSVESPNVFSADVEGSHGARWIRPGYLVGHEEHLEHRDLTTAMTFHFVVRKPEDASRHFHWKNELLGSPALEALHAAVEDEDAVGLAVQYTLLGMAPPEKPDTPAIHELFGTIGVAREDDLPTSPPGRLLVPVRSTAGGTSLGPASVSLDGNWATFNLPATFAHRLGDGGVATAIPRAPLDLHVAGSSTRLARLGFAAASMDEGRIVDCRLEVEPTATLRADLDARGLELRDSTTGEALMRERELRVESDVVNLVLDHPDRLRSKDHARSVEVRSLVRGRPARVGPIRLRNVANPAFHARHLREGLEREAASGEYVVAEPCTRDGTPLAETFTTDERGRATLTLRGRRPGSARLWLVTPEDGDSQAPLGLMTLAQAYDGDATADFWPTANALNVRVLADDGALLDVDPSSVDYQYLYRHGLMIYELLYPFMAISVFSLADEPKFETYARLMYQMCDLANRDKTYYMPSTRDMTQAQTRLLFSYMGNVAEMNAGAFEQAVVPPAAAAPGRTEAQAREEATKLLRVAVELEMSLMLQYLYAGYSVPNYKTGCELVRRGTWTSEQLALACGDGSERPRQGWRGTLLEIAHEEMIHFHVATNLLMSVGAPFHAPGLDWPSAGAQVSLGAETALEPFSLPALARFVHFEQPAPPRALAAARRASPGHDGDGPLFDSVSELYARIRHLIDAHPGLVRGEWTPMGREHHLFLTKRVNERHPDFQMQVWSRDTALLALDFLVSQGEGSLDLAVDEGDAHFHRLRRMTIEVADAMGKTTGGVPWSPAYPALRNPTLRGDEPGWREIRDPVARGIAEINEECFALMLVLMSRHHVDLPSASLRRSRLMNASIDVMTGMVRPLSILLMSLPSGVEGYTAGPTFRPAGSVEPLPGLDARESLREFGARFGALHRRAAALPAMPRAPLGMMRFYETYFDELASRPVLSMTTE